jgi:hypothetical protein
MTSFYAKLHLRATLFKIKRAEPAKQKDELL